MSLDSLVSTLNPNVLPVLKNAIAGYHPAAKSIRELCPLLEQLMVKGALIGTLANSKATVRQLFEVLRPTGDFGHLLASVYIKVMGVDDDPYYHIAKGYMKALNVPLDDIPRFDVTPFDGKTVHIEVHSEDADAVRKYVLVAKYKRLGEAAFVRDLLDDKVITGDVVNMAFPVGSRYSNIYGYYVEVYKSTLHSTPNSSVVYAMYVGLPKRVIKTLCDTAPSVFAVFAKYPAVDRRDIAALVATLPNMHRDLYELVAIRYPDVVRKADGLVDARLLVDELIPK